MNSFSRTMARVVALAAKVPVNRAGWVKPRGGELVRLLFRARFNTQVPPLPRASA